MPAYGGTIAIFVAVVAAGSRDTRYRAARYGLIRPVFHRLDVNASLRRLPKVKLRPRRKRTRHSRSSCHGFHATGKHRRSDAVALAYLAATTLPLFLSSQRTVVTLGAIIFVGIAVAYVFYWEAFVSVWCFFAAAASVVILL